MADGVRQQIERHKRKRDRKWRHIRTTGILMAVAGGTEGHKEASSVFKRGEVPRVARHSRLGGSCIIVLPLFANPRVAAMRQEGSDGEGRPVRPCGGAVQRAGQAMSEQQSCTAEVGKAGDNEGVRNAHPNRPSFTRKSCLTPTSVAGSPARAQRQRTPPPGEGVAARQTRTRKRARKGTPAAIAARCLQRGYAAVPAKPAHSVVGR